MGGMTDGAPALRAPEPLTASHDLSRFTDGVHPSLDQWMRERALWRSSTAHIASIISFLRLNPP